MPYTDGTKMRECDDCDGTGEETCKYCHQKTDDCPACDGTGEVEDD